MVMVIVENSSTKDFVTSSLDHVSSLREERRRTGRYIAAGTAIFLSLLGVYQALVKGTPEYAALFAPAVIMFVYVLWILYASKHYKRNFLVDGAPLVEVTSTPPLLAPPPVVQVPEVAPVAKKLGTTQKHLLNRSYSIA